MLQRNVPGWALFALGAVLGAFIGAGIAAQLFSGDQLVVRVEPAVTPTRVVVYVQGAVRRAGLYEVGSDARVGSVVELAGPLETADLARVPMAERVRDGQTIAVPYQSPVGGTPEEGGVGPREPGKPADQSGPIDVNRASVEELQRLPGVGPALAQRIVTYREQHGPFRSVDELANVAGISERMVAEWGDLVTIGGYRVIGAWLALGIVTSVLVARSSWLAGVGLCSTVLVVVALTKWRVPQDLARTVVMLGVGFALGIGRIVVLHEPSPATAEAVGIVQWSADGLGSDLVALRDDGRLVALSAPSGTTVGAGERVAWRGAYRPGRRRVAGLQVIGTYEVESIRVITGADALLAGVRARVRETVLSTIPEPSGSLALGVLIGDDRGLASETREMLRLVGLSHLTAVSGWNVAVVAGFLEGLFRRMRWRTWVRLVTVGFGVWCYAVVTGLDPPVLRAATMASLYLLARWRGWPREPIAALGWAVVVLLLARPVLVDSLAFQLSGIATAVLCVGGLVYRGRWESVVLPVFVQFAVTPLLLQRFGTYSLVAPLANVLVEPVVPVLMAASVAVLVDLIVPGAGAFLGLPAWLAGRWIVGIGESLARIPEATGVTISPPGWVLAWLYLVCGTWMLSWIDRRSTAP